MCSNAFRPGNVHETFVAGSVRLVRNGANLLQFVGRVEETFVAPGDVIVYLDAKNIAGLRIFHNGCRVVRAQPIGADTRKVQPALFRAAGLGDGGQNRTVKRGDGPDSHSITVLEFDTQPELSVP